MALTMSYSAHKFNALPHIDREELADIDSCAEALITVIAKEGLEKYVGLWNPHKHFDVSEDEQIVARAVTDSDKYVIVNRVEKYSADNIPCAWRTVDGIWTPMQFVTPDFPGANVALHAILSTSQTFLPKINNIIQEYGLQGRVGLQLANNVVMETDKFLMERTDEHLRIQRFQWETEKPGMWTSGKYIKTYWGAVPDVGSRPMAGCHISHGGCATPDHKSW